MIGMELVELVQSSKSLEKTAKRVWLPLLRKYFRIEVVGMENIPRTGPALITPNHSGFAGADAVLLTHVIKRSTRRRARLLAHRAFFDFSETLKTVSESFGLKKAGIASGVEILKREQLLILFPEGESGNFKPTAKAYELQSFHTGFLRIALQSGAPIVPSYIIGAEESHLNLGNIDFSNFIKGIRIPLPVNFVPLPAKWKIVILPPVDIRAICRKEFRALPETAFVETLLNNQKELKRLAALLQRNLQKAINQELKNRPFIYFKTTRKILEQVKVAYSRVVEIGELVHSVESKEAREALEAQESRVAGAQRAARAPRAPRKRKSSGAMAPKRQKKAAVAGKSAV